MNDSTQIDTPDTFTSRAIPLLKEYLEKLVIIKKQLRRMLVSYLSNKGKYGPGTKNVYLAEYDAITQQVNRLFPAVMQFNQQVSGMVDQGNLTPLMRAELQLRLTELESTFYQIQPLIQAYRSQFI